MTDKNMLINLLEKHKTKIIDKWIECLRNSYSGETAKFLKSQNDPFANPVGNTISTGLAGLFELILKEAEPNAIKSILDPVLRIRAIQSFTPSQATDFLFSLKKIIKEVLGNEILQNKKDIDEWFVFEIKIDQLIQTGFDIYMECITKLYELKATEMKKRTFSAFERAGLVKDNT
ncbi:MAG: RsbRD N-terminal domain-containing protein [Deltaproteobacteria bacterium]|nr:RsbRD N-terminal domain-containing protein [Deltaproteobacteria bacterium]